MSERDSFQRGTAPLGRFGGTQPLRPQTRPLTNTGALAGQTADMVKKSLQTIESLEPRVELLLRSCERAKLEIPGLEAVQPKHALSPKGEQIVAYLATSLLGKSALVREIQVAVFRFYEAVRLIIRAQAELDRNHPQQQTLEELKLQIFYLCRFHEVFKEDRVLAQLFPAPETLQAKAKTAEMSAVERLKAKKHREELLARAETLRASLAPRMETLLLTLDIIEKDTPMDMRALLTGSTRTARLLALGIGTNAELIATLAAGRQHFQQLDDQLAEVRAGGDTAPLQALIPLLSRLAINARQHPLLRDLFPTSDEGLFPEEQTIT
ncbi:MAG: hypothetical protein VKP62_08450 [Candidatus Sericytochromatia bacterium]|nr:hypothetical protein [Candidatus Sericytochromatia bacterium]